MAKYLPLANLSAFNSRMADIETLLGLPSEAGKTARYSVPWKNGSNAYLLEMDDSDYAAISSILTADEIASVITSTTGYILQAVSPTEILRTVKYLIVCDGDSLTYGGTASNPYYKYPAQLGRLLGANLTEWCILNFGVAGQRLDQMEADAASQIDSLIAAAPASAVKILIGWGGQNDLGQTSLATAKARAATYFTNRVAAGWDYVVSCTTTASGIDPATMESFNQLIRDNHATWGTVLADLHSIPEFSDSAAIATSPYYADGTHMNDVGYGLIAAFQKEIIAPLLL